MLPPLQCMGIQFGTSSHRVWVKMDQGAQGVCYTVSMGARTSSRSYAAVGATAATTTASSTCTDDKKETWALKRNYFEGTTSMVADPGQALKLEIWAKKVVSTDGHDKPVVVEQITTHCGCMDTVKMVAESEESSLKKAIGSKKIDCLGTGGDDDPYYDCTFPELLFSSRTKASKTFWKSDSESRLTAAIPMENRYCSCKLSVLHGLQLQSLWRIATAAVS